MKKILTTTIAFIMLLALVMPLTLQATVSLTSNLTTSEMKVGEYIEVTVKTTNEAEAIQFDLEYDSSVYKYILNSGTSDLDITATNPITKNGKNVVRIFAVDKTGDKTDTVTLKFEAIDEGTDVPFKVSSLETDGTADDVSSAEITVDKVKSDGTKKKKDEKDNLPNTGVTDTTVTYSIAGVYADLLPAAEDGTKNNSVPYAFKDSDETLTVEKIKEEFPTATVSGISNPVKTGDVFYIGGTAHTVIIYGDVSLDGKVTAYDALLIFNHLRSDLPFTLTDIQKEAADIQNDGNITEDDVTKAMEKFVLKLQNKNADNITGTVITKYPSEYSEINVSNVKNKTYRYDDRKNFIAKVSSNKALTEDMVSGKITSGPSGAEIRAVETATGSGEYYLNLYAPTAGTYKIKPCITGNKVDGKTIYDDEITVTVEEVYTVSEVKLVNYSTPEISIGMDTTLTVGLEYYHNYVDKDGILIKQVKVPNEQVGSVVINRGTETHVSNVTLKNSSSTATAGSQITCPTSMTLAAYAFDASGNNASIGTETMKITVQHDSAYSETLGYSATGSNTSIDVIVKAKEISEISLDNSEIDLWTFQPVDNETPVQSVDGFYYTILEINSVKDVKGNPVTLYNADLNNGVINFYENGVEEYIDEEDPEYSYEAGSPVDILVEGFVKNGSSFEIASSNETPIDAIGIAFTYTIDEDTEEDDLELILEYAADLEEGLQILNSEGDSIFEIEVNVIIPVGARTYSSEPEEEADDENAGDEEDQQDETDDEQEGEEDETEGDGDPEGEQDLGNAEGDEQQEGSQSPSGDQLPEDTTPQDQEPEAE